MAIVADTWIHDPVHLVVIGTTTRAITVELFPTVNVAALAMGDVRDGAALEVFGVRHGVVAVRESTVSITLGKS